MLDECSQHLDDGLLDFCGPVVIAYPEDAITESLIIMLALQYGIPSPLAPEKGYAIALALRGSLHTFGTHPELKPWSMYCHHRVLQLNSVRNRTWVDRELGNVKRDVSGQ